VDVPVQLVCLDLAGTTVRDDGAVERAFLDAVAAVVPAAGPLDPEAVRATVRATMGRSKLEVLTDVYGDAVLAARANAAFESSYAALVEAGAVGPIDGAAETVEALRDAGARIAFTTGFAPATRDLLLRSLGWTGLADVALSPADTPLGRGRPFPDMVLTALLRLGIADVRAVAVAGDTTSDLVAGWRAGAGVVAGVLTGAHDRPMLASAPHTHLLASVVELPAVVLG
jgi:phosphonatase-like hydrolase